MPNVDVQRPRYWPPWLVWGLLLVVVSATEFGVMILLPWVLPQKPSRSLESAVDSLLLTAVLSPVVWWVVVRPLQYSARLRERFLADLFTAMEEERRRIAVELHDGVGQSLTLLVSGLRRLKNLPGDADVAKRGSDLRDLAERALKDAKQLSQGLRPSLLDDLGLAPAIERVAADVREQHSLPVSVDVEAVAGRRLAGPVETAIFRICQEALANVVTHAKAGKALVRLDIERDTATLEVEDDGCGIDPSRLHQAAGHLGLVGMRERATLLGGVLRVESTVGHGTRVTATIPLENRRP